MSESSEEARIKRNEQDIQGIEGRLKALSKRIDDLESKFDRWSGALKAVGWIVATLIALVSALKDTSLFS